jgi:AraC-like DNA-binding protein
MHLHSLPAQAGLPPCESVTGPAPPRLRPYVIGYAGFRTTEDGVPQRRVLPLNATTMIIDFTGHRTVVTGPRSVPEISAQADWRHGVTVGLSPAGVSALFGMPMRELVHTSAPLDALLGPRAAELADRLAGAPGWRARFALLDELLTSCLDPGADPDDWVTRAWWRLQHPTTIAGLARTLGVSTRYLELAFRRRIGLPPKTVARIARFQRAVHTLISAPAGLEAAVACGYADQPHFNREFRAMTGLTPTQLFAFVQDRRAPAHLPFPA